MHGHKQKRDIKFDKSAIKYDKGFEGKFSQKFYHHLIHQMKLESGMVVLDVGCGTGALLKRISDNCDIKGYGIDIEPNMIAVAKQKCPDMEILIAKCENTPFESQSFDILVNCMAYHHFADKVGFAKEASRILKPNGTLYVADIRFPKLMRKMINAILRHQNIVGKFCAPQEINDNFSNFRFKQISVFKKGFVQIIEFKKIETIDEKNK